MSKLSRYNLLISLVRRELKCQHILLHTTDPQHNQLLYCRSIEAWIFLSEDLMCRRGLITQARNVRLRNLVQLLNSADTTCVLQTLKKGYDLLIDHISQKRVLHDYMAFKGLFSEDEQSLIGYLFSPIKEALQNVLQSQTVVSNGCYRSFAVQDMWICAHYLLFLTKINFKGVGLEEKALRDYLDYEAEVASFDVSSVSSYLKPLQSILHDWLEDWDYDGSMFGHGSGSVADTQRHKVHKYLGLKTDAIIKYLYANDLEAIEKDLPFGSLARHLNRCSKLKFVPKNITKLRSISMEPATLQYLQQGCMKSLYAFFKSNKTLNRILKLEDQSQNKSFAYHGSITNEYATIDLSHASDSVNWVLTQKLFCRVPKLLKWLRCTRSTHTLLPNGVEQKLFKFAPMGSALCFPIESLIFAAIAKLSIQLSKEEALDRDNVTGIRNTNTYFTVYGDDIIIPKYAADKCLYLLRLFGFTPNEEKSYIDGPFKESCGGNYFCGHDITPIKFTPKFSRDFPLGVSPEAYTALCSYANLAHERGLYLFRLYCIRLLFEAGIKPLFVDSYTEAPGIYSPTPTNFHLKKVYSKRYQKFEYLFDGVTTVAQDACEYVSGTIRTKYGSLVKTYHVDHIFLYDYLALKFRQESEVATSLSSINAKINRGVLVFDQEQRYSRTSLLPQVFKFTLCRRDAI